MSKYTVVLSKKAQKQLDKLSDNVAQPIFEAILNLEDNLSFTSCFYFNCIAPKSGDFAEH